MKIQTQQHPLQQQPHQHPLQHQQHHQQQRDPKKEN